MILEEESTSTRRTSAWVAVLICLCAESALGQLTRVSSAGDVDGAMHIGFTALEVGGPASVEYAAFGIRFAGIESVPTFIRYVPDFPSFLTIYKGIINVPLEGSSADKPFVITFEFPVSFAGFELGNGDASTPVIVKAFTPTGDLLGTIEDTGPENDPEHRELFIGFTTTDPRSIATVVIDYGQDAASEQINDLFFKHLSPLKFRLCLPQIGYGRVGPDLLTTTISIGILYTTGDVKLELFDAQGNPTKLSLNGDENSVFEFELPITTELVTDGPSSEVKVAHGCFEANVPIGANVVYAVTREGEQTTTAQAGISAAKGRLRQIVPLKKLEELGLDTAIAVANLSDLETRVKFSLVQASLEPLDDIFNDPVITLPPRGQRAFFLSELCDLAVPPKNITYCISNFLANSDFLVCCLINARR